VLLNEKLCALRLLLQSPEGSAAAGQAVKDMLRHINSEQPHIAADRQSSLREVAESCLGAPTPQHAADMVALVEAVHKDALDAQLRFSHSQVRRVTQAMEVARDELAKVAGGGEDGASWKDGLAENSS